MPRVTVIMPVRNEARRLGDSLAHLGQSTDRDFEVLIVDDASTDDTVATAQRAAATAGLALRVVSLPHRQGPAAAINLASRHSDAPLLFFCDGDCAPAPDWIAQGVAALSAPGVCAVEGAVYYAEPRPTFRHRVPLNPFYNLTRRGALTIPGTDYANGNFAVRREAFVRVGGFNAARYAYGREDTDLGLRLRACGTIAYNPAMRVLHSAELWTFADLLRNARRYAADVRIFKDHGEFTYRRGRILHPRFLAELLCPPLIAWRYRPRSAAEWLFVPQFYVYLMALRVAIWRSAAREGVWIV
jgi:GT2 family glycosyltransferase